MQTGPNRAIGKLRQNMGQTPAELASHLRPRIRSTDLMPEGDWGRLSQEPGHFGQEGLEVGPGEVIVQVLPAGPVLVEQESGGIIRGLVEVVVEATRLLAGDRDERKQFLPQRGFLAGPGFNGGDDSECIHEFCEQTEPSPGPRPAPWQRRFV